MDKVKIVTGQKITQEKLERAKQLRRELTPAERKLWGHLRANRLGGWHFRRQQIIAGFIVDFYCHKAGLVIEIDGPIHEEQNIEDSERTQVLIDLGLNVIRFNNRQVMNHLDQVLDYILDSLNSCSPSRVRKVAKHT